MTARRFQFSNSHHELMARDEASVYGWRYEPRIMFESGRGVMLRDVDGTEYYDLTSGMMCMVLGHSHPELTETIREQAERLVPPVVLVFQSVAGRVFRTGGRARFRTASTWSTSRSPARKPTRSRCAWHSA